ncbi:hypothetical protein CDL15_Pgr026184 [Punica granatum]|nr:hypothetical protein CDL15_Pgr026184 [Punica granatum]
MSAHSSPFGAHVLSPPTPIASAAYSGAFQTHLSPPTSQTSSNFIDPVRFTALEGMVNQLAANINTNMIELMAMLRDQNRASSSYTPPPEHRVTVDPNPVVPPIYVSESEDMSFFTMTHVPAVHPINDPLPPPPAPTSVPLPPPAFLSADSAVHAPPPLAMLGSTPCLHSATYNSSFDDELTRSCSYC